MADEETGVIDKKEEMKMEDTAIKDVAEENDVKASPSKTKDAGDGGKANGEEKETKSEEDEDEDDDEEEDEDEVEEEELPPGLLEQPLEVEGKRQKKKVERLSASMVVTPTEKPQLDIVEGSGTKLGDIPYVSHYINATKATDLKPLHRFLFFRLGAVNDIKRNIRKFSGFTEDKDSKEREKRVAIATKMGMAELKNISQWLGLKQSGSKKEVVERIIEYLESPSDQGMEPKKRGTKAKAVAKKGTKRKRKTEKKEKKEKPKKKKPAKKSKAESEDEDEEEEEEEEEEQEDDEDAEEEEESEDEAPKKKKQKVEVKKKVKATPKKTGKENGKKEKANPKKEKKPPKKEAKKKTTPKKKSAAEELSDLSGDDDDSDSDNETLIEAIKPPSDDEIKKTVKNILEGADLETVTMKTVVKQVYAKYPKFDLSDRKDFIKSTVREVIS